MKEPTKFADEYTEQEREEFREKFKPVARRVRILRRIIWTSAACFVLILLTAALLEPPKISQKWPVILGFIAFSFMFLSNVWLAFLHLICPACKGSLESFDSFCPKCGAEGLQRFQGHYGAVWAWCNSCNSSMHPREGRRRDRDYKIKTCSHCGLMLDEKGL
jgi:hypothetical protein